MSNSLLELEQKYCFDKFNNEQAFEFGMKVLEVVKERKLKNIRMRVTYNDDIVFQYLMDGKEGEIWLNRKEKTVLRSGHSSLYVTEHVEDYGYMKNNDEYVICGGGFPLVENGEVKGAFCVSGLVDRVDHEVVIEALERMDI